MKKYDLERLEDNYINLYEEWIFIKSFEYSAIILNQEFGYRLLVNCDKKKWLIYLESWFPKNKKDIIFIDLKSLWYSIRFFEKSWVSVLIEWNKKLIKSEVEIVSIKRNLVKFY